MIDLLNGFKLKECLRRKLVLRQIGVFFWLGVSCFGVTAFSFAAEKPKGKSNSRETTNRSSIISIDSVSTQAPNPDALKSITSPSTLPKRFDGTLSYSFEIPFDKPGPRWQHVLVARQIGEAANKGILTFTVSVPIPYWAHSPQLSPDGKKLLFLYGDPSGSDGPNWLFILNLVSRQIVQGSSVASAGTRPTWSPNSRYVAYMDGITSRGEGAHNNLTLTVFDAETAKRHLIEEAADVYFSWTTQNTLLYMLISFSWEDEVARVKKRGVPDPVVSDISKAGSGNYKIQPSGIYETTPDGQKRHCVIENGGRPLPSPDNRWILFIGSTTLPKTKSGTETKAKVNSTPNPKEPPENPFDAEPDTPEPGKSVVSYCIYDRIEKKVSRIQASAVWEIDWVWSNNSDEIIGLKRTFSAPYKPTLLAFNAKSQERKTIGNIHILDLAADVKRSFNFALLSVSSDNQYAYMLIDEIGGPKVVGSSIFDTNTRLLALDLKTLKAASLLEIKNPSGTHWRSLKIP